ncbi:WhiB family transcriptional regulator [Streptomyces sp. BR123]|uniref:WhiB family transcriptional regulator n=1 Tax=Streptomyces sp. BR123 TaxID=2749828 RepID=UPI0015C46092|nr:WhiB family transcriptional regulator [Streptomyces sp. BR123]NXY96409.1 WhiB family transcriptional regulator [Streptomyces sp. BR123]
MTPQPWEDDAACREIGVDFFHPTGRGPEFKQAVEAAKRVCCACPVRRHCLALALEIEGRADRYSRDGIWGGLTGPERAALRTTAA